MPEDDPELRGCTGMLLSVLASGILWAIILALIFRVLGYW
jgi:hypothetical protein